MPLNRLFSSLLLVTLAAVVLALPGGAQNRNDPYAGQIAPTEPRSPEQERLSFRLPPGFEAQLVAAEPDIRKPMNLAFDARGRLWVTDSVEYPFPAAAGKGRDTVKILEDVGPDGRARKVTTFTGGLNIPIGLLPLPTANATEPARALVYSIPQILRLSDTNGDNKADNREFFYGTYEYRDTHGMTSAFTLGFDGWVYACHGFANRSTLRGSDGQAITMESGNTYRMRTDGSHLEQYTWGQVNPFGLSLDPLGNLYSADCHSQPIYQLLRGAYYPSFGKPHDGLGFGPEMITNYKGSTAISGIVYYAAEQFPAAHRGTAYIGDVVTNRIEQFRLEWSGTSPRAIQQDFLVSTDPWFRPVDLKLGPDGALYVADFYNRIIGHYEVPLTHPGRDRERGRIWRIVYRGPDGKAPAPPAPRDFTQLPVRELVNELGNANLTVRLQAQEQLILRGGREGIDAARALLPPASNPWARAHALWVLERSHGLDDWSMADALDDGHFAVRVHALRVLAERPALTASQRERVATALKDDNPFVRRGAAEVLGRHPSPTHLRALLELRHVVPPADTHLLHVVRMALRDTLRAGTSWKLLAEGKWSEKDARALADVAVGVPQAAAADYLLGHVQKYPEPTGRLADYVHHIGRHAGAGFEATLVPFLRGSRPEDLGHQAALCKALQQGLQERGATMGTSAQQWAADLTARLLASPGDGEVRAGIELAGALKLKTQANALARLATDRRAREERRNAALTSLASIDVKRATEALGQVLTDPDAPFALREHAARTLAQLNQPEPLGQLVAALPVVPARVQTVIAVALTGSREGLERLLSAIEAGKASPRLLRESTVARWLAIPRNVWAQERVAKLTRGLPAADEKVQSLMTQRQTGYAAARPDPALGARLFEKHCGICHQISGKGAKIGPQLDGIGVRGLDRLLEDVLDPSRNVDQAFRLTTLQLKNGQVASGLLLKEEGKVLVLADAQGKEVRVPAESVDERSTSQLSPMPANFAEQVSEAEFYHLMAYLLSQKPTAPASPTGR